MFEILNTTKRTLPSSKKHFEEIKGAVLGKKYELSLVFIGSTKSKKLNKEHRKKDYPANVLSFPLEKDSGEIFINLDTKQEAKKFDMSWTKYIDFLLIHGALHLKGMDHGEKMEKEEQRFLKKLTK